jgi:hypothetical protein
MEPPMDKSKKIQENQGTTSYSTTEISPGNMS